MIITRTPFRLSLFGGGLDYPEWFCDNPSWILTAAINRYSYISIRRLPPFFEHRSRIVYSKIELVKNNSEIVHPGVKGCLDYLGINDGLEIHYDGDLPSNSGIGSSSSFTVGLVKALLELRGEDYSKNSLARSAISVEQDVIKECVGIQDQISAAFGGCHKIIAGPHKDWEVVNMYLSENYRKKLFSRILLGYSGISRNSQTHATEKVKNILNGRSKQYLTDLADISKEAIEHIGSEGDFKSIGTFLQETWKLKQNLSETLQNPFFAHLIKRGLDCGAYGGKLMGAGGGGFFYLLAEPELHDKIKQALPEVRVWASIQNDLFGSKTIFNTEYI
jgi:D-glycero-alpha-D-manno-heptose-7-phosphate kinase